MLSSSLTVLRRTLSSASSSSPLLPAISNLLPRTLPPHLQHSHSPVPLDNSLAPHFFHTHSSAHRHAEPAHAEPSVSDPPENDPSAEQRSPPTARVLRLVDELAELTLIEVSDVTRLLKKKLGIPDMGMMGGSMMPMGGMPMGGGMPFAFGQPGAAGGPGEAGAGAPVKEEKTIFDVKLEKFDAAAKLKVIKEVRALTNLGLKEAKDLVEGAPAVVKKSVTKEEAESMLEKLKAVGATCVLE